MPAEQVVKIAKWATVGVTLLVAAVVGKSASDQWFTFQTFLHRTPFGKVDAVFGKDIGFYVFVLPMLMYLRHYLMILTVVSALGSLGIYFAKGGLATPHYRISSRAAKHIGILVCLFLGLVAWGYWFDRFSYLFSLTGVTFGAGYADVHVRIPICWVMLLVSLAASVTILIAGFKRSATLAAATPAVFVGLQIIMWIIPGLVQTMLVSPNELDKERPFIQNNIQATREAYGLDKVEVRQFSADGKLDMATIEAEEATTKNVRLWDWRPLQATYSQIQGLRPYYQFHDVDVDRYTIEGQYQSVVLSLRELDSSHIPARARRWLGLHLMYTHGYGLCMSPVSEVTEEGNPRLIIRDIPPVTERGLKVTQPAIYFGELPARYIFVRTKQKEFDYPASPKSKYTTYEGKAGIGVSGFLRRLLFAWHFGDKNIIFTDQFTPESRI
ncbi:MAG: UPF0182 family protein, partial [Phycisphaerae bacterium]|nr:UPF0182 family protein [Phycisphaerae bacterium]